MELSLGRRADYAIRATLDLARHHGGALRKAREIGTEMDIPASFLPQILAQLVHAGIAASTAGPRGGYGLARDPSQVSMLDVIAAADGQEPSSPDCILRGGPCRWDDRCAVHIPWLRAQQALLGHLGATTFADLSEIDAQLEAGTYLLPTDVLEPERGPAVAPETAG